MQLHRRIPVRLDEVNQMLNENAAVPLWPQAGQALGLTRGAAYRGGVSGDIRVIRVGRLMRVPTQWLREQLGLARSA
jgi:hypothetical protein